MTRCPFGHDSSPRSSKGLHNSGADGAPQPSQYTFNNYRDIPTNSDPLSAYDKLRENGSVIKLENEKRQGATWLVLGYQAAKRVLESSEYEAARISKSGGGTHCENQYFTNISEFTSSWVVHQEGAVHEKLRDIFKIPLEPKQVVAGKDQMGGICSALFDAALGVADKDTNRPAEFCLIDKLARPLPLAIFLDSFGLSSLANVFSSDDVNKIALGAASSGPNYNNLKAARHILSQKISTLVDTLKECEAGRELLGRSGNFGIGEVTFMSNVVFYVLAGHETTSGLIGNLVYTLIKEPGVWSELKNNFLHGDGSLVARAVTELLRYDPPVQSTVRHALVNHNLEGHQIADGDVLIVVMAAANRDPLEFGQDAAKFNIHRNKGTGLAFGAGTHFCHGTHLALMEGKLFLREALRRIERFELQPDKEPNRLEDVTFRGFTMLPVRAFLS